MGLNDGARTHTVIMPLTEPKRIQIELCNFNYLMAGAVEKPGFQSFESAERASARA